MAFVLKGFTAYKRRAVPVKPKSKRLTVPGAMLGRANLTFNKYCNAFKLLKKEKKVQLLYNEETKQIAVDLKPDVSDEENKLVTVGQHTSKDEEGNITGESLFVTSRGLLKRFPALALADKQRSRQYKAELVKDEGVYFIVLTPVDVENLSPEDTEEVEDINVEYTGDGEDEESDTVEDTEDTEEETPAVEEPVEETPKPKKATKKAA